MKLEFDGNETFYELHGESGAPVVVLSHALAANRAMWQAQIDILQAHYRVLCYDIRGHGESGSPPEPYSLDDLADDAEKLLDALGFDQVQWVGACLGGMIGQNLALRPSKRIAGLVLADTMATLVKEHRST